MYNKRNLTSQTPNPKAAFGGPLAVEQLLSLSAYSLSFKRYILNPKPYIHIYSLAHNLSPNTQCRQGRERITTIASHNGIVLYQERGV